jgi:hypothetical protein
MFEDAHIVYFGDGLPCYTEEQKLFYGKVNDICEFEDQIILNIGRTLSVTLDGDFTIDELERILIAMKEVKN